VEVHFVTLQEVDSLSILKPPRHDHLATMDLLQSGAFRQHAESLMQTYKLPGLSITISQNNEVSSLGLGVANLHNAANCTPDTLYDIASSSKSLTAASVALLVEDEENHPEVQWDTPLHDILPEDFVMPTSELNERITVADILSHRTGMAL
jgi:CubicO group peptidase (beta-lactamase class C family)